LYSAIKSEDAEAGTSQSQMREPQSTTMQGGGRPP